MSLLFDKLPNHETKDEWHRHWFFGKSYCCKDKSVVFVWTFHATVHSFAAITGASDNATLNFDPPAGVFARSVYFAGDSNDEVNMAELNVMGWPPPLPPPPPPPVTVVRPHAPTSICGVAVTYDANGNTTSYDADGAGPIQPRSFTYDGENRPLVITQNGNPASFTYAPDGERAGKSFGGNAYSFLGNAAPIDHTCSQA